MGGKQSLVARQNQGTAAGNYVRDVRIVCLSARSELYGSFFIPGFREKIVLVIVGDGTSSGILRNVWGFWDKGVTRG